MGSYILSIIHLKRSSFILLYLFSVQTYGQVKLPAIISDRMVLQQKSSVPLWGKAKPGSKIRVKPSWQKQVVITTALTDSSWKVKVNTPSAGGPYSIKISDGSPIKINNILIGEVWLCSGQSNMTMPVKGFPNDPVEGSTDEILNAKNKNIRFFDVGRSSALELQKDVKGSWKEVTSESLSNFSATAWFFGKTVQQELNIPVGLITSSWGGSNIETWMSKEALSAFSDIKIPEVKDSVRIPNQTPTILFNNMIYPVTGYGIKGVIWYQGESNRLNPAQYKELLPAMVKNWRSIWGGEQFPFYYLQIAPFNYGKGLSSAYIREAQLKAQKLIPNSGIGFLMDAGEESNIHPANKKAAGMRLATLALVKSYGFKGLPETGPVNKSMQVKDTTAYLFFEHAEGGLTSWGKTLNHFEIAGENKIFYPAKAVITKQGVAVSNAGKVKNPVAVRYAFKDFVIGDLFNNAGFPATSFRTDDWVIEKRP